MKMKNLVTILLPAAIAMALCSCEKAREVLPEPLSPQEELCSPMGVARMLASLPIGQAQLEEVHQAVNASSGNGYDEEYMLRDLLSCPGAGVGDGPETRAASAERFSSPLKDLISDYLASYSATKGGTADVQAYLDELSASGIQIYWPYSEEWDGVQMPLITYNPGNGAESNFDMEASVLIDENLASKRPVWVINSNDDCAFTPMEFFRSVESKAQSEQTACSNLLMKSFTMLRNYDSWFAGASEFFIRCGSLRAAAEISADSPQAYIPEITDLMVVVRRRDVGKEIPFNALLLSGIDEQLRQIALQVTESDGGSRSSWKCQAKVMIKSKSYGIDVELPFYSQDDIVWRGPIDLNYIRALGSDKGRFGDVEIRFAME